MKLCKDCKHVVHNVGYYCENPRRNNEVIDLVEGKSILCPTAANAMRYHEHLCGSSGKWWEAKALDPGEGWRLLYFSECFEQGDQYTQNNGKTWKDVESFVIGDRYDSNIYAPHRRRIVAELQKCPFGHDANVFRFDGEYFVECVNKDCAWRGGKRMAKEEAIKAWNGVMEVFHQSKK